MTELEIELKKASDSLKARRIIAMLSQDFIFDGCTILVHGFSRVVLEVLKTAAQNKKLIRVFCTENNVKKFLFRKNNMEKVHVTDVSKVEKVDDTGLGDKEDAKKKKE
nr:translation initiation factor eif-2b subunit alpha [Quercus suber]